MSNTKGTDKGDAFGAGITSMLAFFTSTLDRNWALLSSLKEFPQAGAETDEKFGEDADHTNIVDVQIQAITSGWKMLGDAMRTAFDDASRGRDDAAARMSQSMATAFRSYTGIDQNDMLNGLARGWSPKQVAFRSFGLGDSDALAISAEMVQLAAASGKSARAMMRMYSIVGNSWLEAAGVFSKAYSGRDAIPTDPARLQRAWAAIAEPILQETLRSEAFVEANAEFIRTASRQAKARSSLAKRFTDFIEAPHRQEMNETYEAIQELRREVRALKRNQTRLEKTLAATTAP